MVESTNTDPQPEQPVQQQATTAPVEETKEVKPEETEAATPKHEILKQEQGEDVEILQNKFTKNIVSPFINHQKSWDDEEHFKISEDLQKGITQSLGFIKPSNIQAVSIPLIYSQFRGEHVNLIAQSKNGTGKTGAFTIGSTLRVDPKIPKTQVLCVCHVRELSSQIAEVYEKICEFSDIKVTNYTATGKSDGQHIVVTTLGKLNNALKGGRGKRTIDLSELRCFVVDEADVFFQEERNFAAITEVVKKHISSLKQPVQYVLFSATYPEEVKEKIGTIITQAQQIHIKKEQLQLDHIQQFSYKCEKGKKADFMKEIFNLCEMTQTVVFVNTKKFAEILHNLMRKENYKSTIIFGDMDWTERDEMIAKFKSGEVHVIITTNMLARGIDVPEVQIVLNFDVPTMGPREKRIGDPENYMHRIGRTGRFGTQGLAITIYDREEDREYLDQIIDHYQMHDKMKTMTAPEQLKMLLDEINTSML